MLSVLLSDNCQQCPKFVFSYIENREDILNAGDKLTEVLEEANTLFNEGN